MYCVVYCIVMYCCIGVLAVLRCIALYCCIAIQWARDNAYPLYCPIQQVFPLYCCRARCIGFALHWRGDGGHGWSDRHVDASLSLAMLSWVPLTAC